MNNMSNFVVFIIAFDDKAYEKLKELSFENVRLILLQEFEDHQVIGIVDRSAASYIS